MFEAWHDYYFMIGSCAAALIGLMFVVMTLTAGRDRSQADQGKHLYSSPIVWHLAVILALSGAALAPNMTARIFAVGAGGLGLLGFAMGVRSAVGIAHWAGAPNWKFDSFWYGVAPAVGYVGLSAAAVALLRNCEWAMTATAAALMILLLISIHAEWDLVTFLAPAAGQSEK
jgi:hypothetical protein